MARNFRSRRRLDWVCRQGAGHPRPWLLACLYDGDPFARTIGLQILRRIERTRLRVELRPRGLSLEGSGTGSIPRSSIMPGRKGPCGVEPELRPVLGLLPMLRQLLVDRPQRGLRSGGANRITLRSPKRGCGWGRHCWTPRFRIALGRSGRPEPRQAGCCLRKREPRLRLWAVRVRHIFRRHELRGRFTASRGAVGREMQPVFRTERVACLRFVGKANGGRGSSLLAKGVRAAQRDHADCNERSDKEIHGHGSTNRGRSRDCKRRHRASRSLPDARTCLQTVIDPA